MRLCGQPDRLILAQALQDHRHGASCFGGGRQLGRGIIESFSKVPVDEINKIEQRGDESGAVLSICRYRYSFRVRNHVIRVAVSVRKMNIDNSS